MLCLFVANCRVSGRIHARGGGAYLRDDFGDPSHFDIFKKKHFKIISDYFSNTIEIVIFGLTQTQKRILSFQPPQPCIPENASVVQCVRNKTERFE